MNLSRVLELRALVERSEVADWPTCLHCTDASQHREGGARWVPVEGYSVDPGDVFAEVPLAGGARVIDRVNKRGGLATASAPGLNQSVTAIGRLNPSRLRGSRGWFTVVATCHGYEGIAQVDVPLWWGVAKVRAAIRSLMFFGPSLRAEHREMT